MNRRPVPPITFILLTSLAALAAAQPSIGAERSSVVLYKASDLRAFQAKLAPKVNAMKVATQKLDDFGNHNAMVAHREGSGQVEIHEHYADVFVVLSGVATLVAGGKAEGVKPTEPGEFRGVSIRGGERRTLGAGDIVHIPAGIPHPVLLEPGHQFTYFILKVETK